MDIPGNDLSGGVWRKALAHSMFSGHAAARLVLGPGFQNFFTRGIENPAKGTFCAAAPEPNIKISSGEFLL